MLMNIKQTYANNIYYKFLLKDAVVSILSKSGCCGLVSIFIYVFGKRGNTNNPLSKNIDYEYVVF